MEERSIMAHNRLKIQVLREDYEEMVGTHSGLKQDLGVAQMQLRQLVVAAQKVREDREEEVKRVYERCVVMEGEARVVEAIQREHDQVDALVRGVYQTNVDLTSQLSLLHSEIHDVRLQSTDVAPLKSDLNTMRQQLLQARAAIEFEKKTRAANLEQYQQMENNMMSIQSEINRLRHHLARDHQQPPPLSNTAHGYLENYGHPDTLLQGGHYPVHQTTIHDAGPYSAVFKPSSPNSGHDPFDAHSDSCTKG